MVTANTPLPSDAYVPILKGKMAELGALETYNGDRIVPLVEVSSPERGPARIARAWAKPDDAIWLHSLNLDGTDETDFATYVEDLFRSLRPDVLAVPVITIVEGPDTLSAIHRIVTDDERGVVLRIDAEDILDDASDTAADIRATLDDLGLDPSDTDVVIDAGLVDGPAPVRAAVAGQCLAQIPDLADWRSVVVAFSAFPDPLSSVVPRSSVRALPRLDATAFTATRRLTPRNLVFGDYALGNPSYEGVPFTPIPNIRYTVGAEWYIHRAESRNDPASQFRALAADIVGASYFAGAAFSPGDQQIAGVASGVSGPGNPMTHLREGISHHVHVVAQRLATLGEP